jgi:hypothetical protein
MCRSRGRLDRLLTNELDVTPKSSLPFERDIPRALNVLPTSESDANVKEALSRTRSTQFERKHGVFRTKPSTLPFNAKKATAALDTLFKKTAPHPAAAKLLQLGADVNYSRHKSESLTKGIRNKDQDDIRSNIF